MPNLDGQPKGYAGEICGFSGDPTTVTRLKELGFLVGDHLEITGRMSWGGVILVAVRGAIFALRRSEASCIQVS